MYDDEDVKTTTLTPLLQPHGEPRENKNKTDDDNDDHDDDDEDDVIGIYGLTTKLIATAFWVNAWAEPGKNFHMLGFFFPVAWRPKYRPSV